MKYARIINDIAVDVREEHPENFFTPNVVAEFVEVPLIVEDQWILKDGTWEAPIIPDPVIQVPLIPIISPVEFKLLFTPQERMAIIAERANDLILNDLFSILDDVRLKEVNLNLESNKALMDYLEGKGLITADRKAEILTGVMK